MAILPDAHVRALNKRFRGLDSETDVLSFPAEGGQRTGGRGQRAEGRGQGHYLGEIAISRGIARKQAKLLRHSLKIEIRVLALHGLLHLLGYDHEVDGGRMARIEGRLRRKAKLPLGLIARSS